MRRLEQRFTPAQEGCPGINQSRQQRSAEALAGCLSFLGLQRRLSPQVTLLLSDHTSAWRDCSKPLKDLVLVHAALAGSQDSMCICIPTTSRMMLIVDLLS